MTPLYSTLFTAKKKKLVKDDIASRTSKIINKYSQGELAVNTPPECLCLWKQGQVDDDGD